MSRANKTKEEITRPEPHEIPVLLNRAKVIHETIATLKKELETLDARLKLVAQDLPQERLTDEKLEGRQAILKSPRWEVPVIFTSDLIIGSFKDGSATHKQLISLLNLAVGSDNAEETLKEFFNAPRTWEGKFEKGKDFRAAAAKILPEAFAAQFVSACISKGSDGIPKNKTVLALDLAKPVPEQTDKREEAA